MSRREPAGKIDRLREEYRQFGGQLDSGVMTHKKKGDALGNTVLDRWGITPEELTELVNNNPSLRGMLIGYVAEHRFRKVFAGNARITGARKYDDHDRAKKGDLVVTYKGADFIFELKSLQTNTVRRTDDVWTGKAQCDASDRRTITLPDGEKMETTCLLVGEFDVLAVNLFAFEEKWRFVYALNRDLPRSRYKRYTEHQREHLLASLVGVTWPPSAPFVEDPCILLDRLIMEQSSG